MSAVIAVTVLLPATQALWPIVAAAAASTAASLGFAAARSSQIQGPESVEVDLALDQAESLEPELGPNAELVFVRDQVTLRIFRDAQGKVGLKVRGTGRSKEELEAVGRKAAQKLVQQYAYHRLMTEMKSRNMTVVDQTVDEDGTVRLQVRTYDRISG